MARFFFDVQNDDALHPDSVGTELTDAEAAGIEAMQAFAELAHAVLPAGIGKHLIMKVRDGAGQQSLELDLVFRVIRARQD